MSEDAVDLTQVSGREACAQCPWLAENARLRALVEQLEARIEELERASHRQAAPFRIPEEKRKGAGTRPGRKACWVLERCFGLRITPGGLTQAMARVRARLSGAYAQLGAEVRRSPVVYADETSWWVNGPGYWLWVFTTPQATLYKIASCRGKEVVLSTLGPAFEGRLVSDCLASYDAIECKKHKCYAHHLRAVAEARRHLPESAYLREVRLMLLTAMSLGEVRDEIPDYEEKRRRIEQWAQRLLHPARADPTEERVANRLRKQQAHLFGFLYEVGMEPTNNRAERQLRPAVIARKVSCGNRTLRGKSTSEVLMSLTVTARQQGKSFAQLVVPALSKAA